MIKFDDDLKNLIIAAKKKMFSAFEKIYLSYRNYVYKMILDFFDYKIPEGRRFDARSIFNSFSTVKDLKK